MCKGSCGGSCLCCKICGALVCLVTLLLTLAAVFGVYHAHTPGGVWTFGTMEGSLSIIALLLTMMAGYKTGKKMCGCCSKGACGGGKCGGCPCGKDGCDCPKPGMAK